jgi:ubiquinone/menaquinone biosynthesis C-methylase UbiE
MPDVHCAAQRGFAQAAQVYERGRPEYPAAIRDWLLNALALRAGTTVLDLGAGTGKFTRVLHQTGASVIAVEPVTGMLRQLSAGLPEVSALAATAQKLPFKPAVAEAVTCAQAFHWFADAAALAEIHRVLKPGGRLGLVWNVRDESVPWVAALSELMRPYESGVPRFYTGRWRETFSAGLFGQLQETRFPYQHVGTPQTVIIDRVLSISFIAALPDEHRARIADQLRALIAATPELRGRDRIAFPYQTHAFCCARVMTARPARQSNP